MLQAVLRTGTQQDSWQVVSPKKAVTQRRLTADEQAEHKAKENTIYDIPASSNAFEVLKQDEQLAEENLEEEEQEEVSEMAVFPGKPMEEVEELEETEAEPGATPHHRSVFFFVPSWLYCCMCYTGYCAARLTTFMLLAHQACLQLHTLLW